MTNPNDLSEQIRLRIESKIPDAQVEVVNTGIGHYSLTVISNVFEGLATVKQHQLVYSSFSDLMAGADAPVHAIDKMDLREK